MKCNNHCSPNRPDCRDNICTIDLRDKALQNHNYRETVWTGCFMQMTVMCIPACSDVGLEIHDNTDQIIRIEQGDRFHLAGRPDIIGINHTIVPSYYTK